MAIAVSLLLPYVLITKKFQLPEKIFDTGDSLWVLFASDVAVGI
jgi:hypothetical protein